MLYVHENKVELRKTHSTYFQIIQCQLALTGAQFCDLAVYTCTFCSIAVIRITFDAQFWENVVDVVGTRYFQ